MTSTTSQFAQTLETRCVVAGGGPAGMMVGYLLARAGIPVIVLEKHGDFLRDFRGDTIHPSTMRLLSELGILGAFLQRPHEKTRRVGVSIGSQTFSLADFSRIGGPAPFIAFTPQWEFLDFLADHAAPIHHHKLIMNTEATGLLRDDEGRIVGVSADGPDGPLHILADLTIAADGRHSLLRDDAGLPVETIGAPMDVLWMRLPRRPNDPGTSLGRIDAGRFVALIERGDYWQCAWVIPKGGYGEVRARGVEAFRDDVARTVPFLADRVDAITSMEDVKLLTVAIDRLQRWHMPGLLFIGDAAHAMSPVGGVGINLAIQDAVAAANRLAPLLHSGIPDEAALADIERRRRFPTVVTQRLQTLAQNKILLPALTSETTPAPPLALRIVSKVPFLQGLVGRLIGIGVRPEHVDEEIIVGSGP